MKILAIALLICCAPMAWATVYTSAATGNWNVNATWSPSTGFPVSGDTVILANGFTVTCPVSVVCVPGSSPTDDTGTPAIQCSTTAGTGVLVVNGTLQWQGPIRQCNANWTVNAGATLTYDATHAATPATALYTWRVGLAASQANAVLLINGTSGSHVTVNSLSNVQSGGYGMVTSFADAGRIEATYSDWTNQGAASAAGFMIQSRLSTSVGRVIFDNSTATNCGYISIANLGAASYFRISYSDIEATVNTTEAVVSDATIPKTTGTRIIQNSVIKGLTQLLSGSGVATGFVMQNTWFERKNYTDVKYAFRINNGASVTTWDQVFVFLAADLTSDSIIMPAGTLTNTYAFRHGNYTPGNARPHPLYSFPSTIDTFVTGWIMEYDGNDDSGAFLLPADASLAGTKFYAQYNVYLPNGAGLSVGGFLNNASSINQTNLKIGFNHNTVAGSNSVPGQVYGVGCESNPAGATWPVDAVPLLSNNIIWRTVSGTADLARSIVSGHTCTISNGAVTVADYNDSWNITNSIYDVPLNQYLVTPGAHDLAVNPNYVDNTRNIYSFDTAAAGLNHAVATAWVSGTSYTVGQIVSSSDAGFHGGATYNWRCTTANTAAAGNKPGGGTAAQTSAQTWEPASLGYIRASLLAGQTFNGGLDSMVGVAVKFVKAGYAPTNAAISTAASDGTTMGAIPYGGTATPGPFFGSIF